jgi:hypothetical protein
MSHRKRTALAALLAALLLSLIAAVALHGHNLPPATPYPTAATQATITPRATATTGATASAAPNTAVAPLATPTVARTVLPLWTPIPQPSTPTPSPISPTATPAISSPTSAPAPPLAPVTGHAAQDGENALYQIGHYGPAIIIGLCLVMIAFGLLMMGFCKIMERRRKQ